MKLKKNTKVEFAELPGTDLHKYLLTKKKGGETIEITGVTTMMRRLGLSKDYSGIKPDVLARAAARGTAIHELFQDFEMNGSAVSAIHFEWDCVDGTHKEEDEIVDDLLSKYSVLSKYYFSALAVEYLVSDNESVASMIDFISQVDDTTVDLIDYKSSSTLDKKGLEWQLSFYKYLFERQNKGINVRNLYGVHCHDAKGLKVVDVIFKGDEAVAEMLNAFKNGVVPADESESALMVQSVDELMPEYPNLSKALYHKRELQEMIDRIDDAYAEAIEALKDRMREQHITEVSIPGGKYVFTEEHSAVRFDSKKFKADHPELAEKYTSTTTVAASLKFYKEK